MNAIKSNNEKTVSDETVEQRRFAEAGQIATQIHTLAWLLGNIKGDNTVYEDRAFGLYMFAEMIAANVEAMSEMGGRP